MVGKSLPDDTGNPKSGVGIEPGDSGMLSGCQGDDFPHIWLAECFVACLHIYTMSMGKMSGLTHFPLEQGCEHYAFLEQWVEDFEHGLYSMATVSTDIQELDASFDEVDDMPSSVFLHSVRSISDNSRLHLASSIKSHKL